MSCGVCTKIIERDDGVLVRERDDVGREQDGAFGDVAALHGDQRLADRLHVIARIDRLDLDARVLLLEIRPIAVDKLGDRPGDGDRVIEADLHIGGPGRKSLCGGERETGSDRRAARDLGHGSSVLFFFPY